MITTFWMDGNCDLTKCYEIRKAVFTKEQHIDESFDLDEYDHIAKHILVKDGDKYVATGRVVPMDKIAKLGRICVLEDFRKNGYGDLVVRMLVRKAFEMGFWEKYLDAQVNVIKFYKKIGFKTVGKAFQEVDIWHVKMKHEGDLCTNCCSK